MAAAAGAWQRHRGGIHEEEWIGPRGEMPRPDDSFGA